jgi:hypothetical protein
MSNLKFCHKLFQTIGQSKEMGIVFIAHLLSSTYQPFRVQTINTLSQKLCSAIGNLTRRLTQTSNSKAKCMKHGKDISKGFLK